MTDFNGEMGACKLLILPPDSVLMTHTEQNFGSLPASPALPWSTSACPVCASTASSVVLAERAAIPEESGTGEDTS
jgi:hypothetical protein